MKKIMGMKNNWKKLRIRTVKSWSRQIWISIKTKIKVIIYYVIFQLFFRIVRAMPVHGYSIPRTF